MEYYAKVNTAHPAIGLISTGEVLTENQVSALGADMIASLLERGVLAACESNLQAAAPSPGDEIPERQEKEETSPDAADGANDEYEDEELPELEIGDDIVSDAPQAPAEPKKAGRRDKSEDQTDRDR